MTKGILIAVHFGLAILLAADFSIAAAENVAVTSTVASDAMPAKAAEALPERVLSTKPVKAPAVELLDINSASAVQLQKTLGIGQETAKKIIAGRPFVKKDQLKSRKILTAAQYYQIKDRIIARRPPVAK